jgi:hypothetical protein
MGRHVWPQMHDATPCPAWRQRVPRPHSLERRTARGRRDNIDHAPGAHDDIATCRSGCSMRGRSQLAGGPTASPGRKALY